MQRGVIEGGDTQEVIYDRIYNDELREYKEGDILLYQDTNWSIYPPVRPALVHTGYPTKNGINDIFENYNSWGRNHNLFQFNFIYFLDW